MDDDDNNNLNSDALEDYNGIKIYLSSLMDRVNEKTLNGIRNNFQQNNNGRLNESQLKAVLESNGVILSNKDFKPMFCKIDVRKESTVSFLQFVVYLAYELRIKSRRHELNEEKQSKLTPKLLPCKLIKDGNRNNIERIAFKPLTDETSHTIQDDGEYVTISRTGEIVFYTMDFEWKNSYKILDSTRSLTASRLTGLMVLPNFNVVCVSTLSGELRFYDATAEEFRLCLTVERMPSTTTCLAYHAPDPDSVPDARSTIAAGNVAGGVTVLEFLSGAVAAKEENPFRGSSVGDARPPSYVFHDIVAGWPCATAAREQQPANDPSPPPPPPQPPPPFRAVQYDGLHPAPVNQVEFCDAGRSFVSVSGDSRKSMACCRVGSPVAARYVPAADGFWCVCAVGGTRVATGGVDGSVRLWDVFAAAAADGRPAGCTELAGHGKAVQHVFYDRAPDGRLLYSVSADRAIRVWDVPAAACLYTFGGAAEATEASDCRRWFPALFNRLDRVIAMVVGGAIVPVRCGKDAARARHVASDSHDTAVTKAMYNRLFHVLISVSGADSVIAVWNVSTGELITRRAMAHTRRLYGRTLPVEITAAGFDPSGGLLVTGAVNGTVHLWDPNNGTCLNRLQIPSKSRISEVIWLPDKILVVGWDRRVTQFDDPLVKCNDKVWLSSHKDVVLSACVQLPLLLVTTSRAGEIGFWRLGTGQLIKKHTTRMKQDRLKALKTSVPIDDSSYTSLGSELLDSGTIDAGGAKHKDKTTETSLRLDLRHDHSAVSSHFLRARPEALTVGSLLVAMRNGVVQLWCTHKVFSYVARFVAVHVDGDYVTAMASDPKSEYLITSTYRGYVKTWYVADFGVGQPRHVVHEPSSAVMSSLRLRFPFLSGSYSEHAPANHPTGPLLVNSYRAHLQCVRHVEFVDRLELVVTSGTDKSIRVWTLAGHYVGTMGTPWPKISNNSVVNVTKFAIPLDIEREGSFTTLKVLRSGVTSDFQAPDVLGKTDISRQQRETEGIEAKRKLQGTKCQKQPLYDIYNELMELVKTETSITDPMEIDIEESMTKIKSSIYIPLNELNNTPKKKQLKGITQRKSTKKGARVAFKI